MEIRNLCKNAIDLLKENPVEKDISKESIAHYKGFEALQYHNLTSYSQYYDDPDSQNKAHELFEEATIIANEWLNPAHPVRLYIADCYSRFTRELLFNDDEASRISREAYDNAQPYLANLINSLQNPAEEQLEYLRMDIEKYS